MGKLFISNNDETVRLFKSDFMEAFSRVHWTVPLYIYVPVVFYFIYRSFFIIHLHLAEIMFYYILGIIAWSLAEYILHRFVFHFEPKSETGKKISFIMHGVHHAYPKDSKRLVMPPSVSIPLAFIFYFISYFLFGYYHVSPFFAGMVSGYLCYDMTHYAIHHFAIKNKFFLKIKTYHMKHHYQNDKKGYGVSQPLWDYVFRTRV
jgi:sterol desaturase/sphingolipid hydroxylase (fatty acid hydroxylase superfamily)